MCCWLPRGREEERAGWCPTCPRGPGQGCQRQIRHSSPALLQHQPQQRLELWSPRQIVAQRARATVGSLPMCQAQPSPPLLPLRGPAFRLHVRGATEELPPGPLKVLAAWEPLPQALRALHAPPGPPSSCCLPQHLVPSQKTVLLPLATELPDTSWSSSQPPFPLPPSASSFLSSSLPTLFPQLWRHYQGLEDSLQTLCPGDPAKPPGFSGFLICW